MLAMDETRHPDLAQPLAVGILPVMIKGLHRSLGTEPAAHCYSHGSQVMALPDKMAFQRWGGMTWG